MSTEPNCLPSTKLSSACQTIYYHWASHYHCCQTYCHCFPSLKSTVLFCVVPKTVSCHSLDNYAYLLTLSTVSTPSHHQAVHSQHWQRSHYHIMIFLTLELYTPHFHSIILHSPPFPPPLHIPPLYPNHQTPDLSGPRYTHSPRI